MPFNKSFRLILPENYFGRQLARLSVEGLYEKGEVVFLDTPLLI